MYKDLKHLFVKDSRERDNLVSTAPWILLLNAVLYVFFCCKKPMQGYHCADIILFNYPKLNLVNKKIMSDPNKLVYNINKI